MTINDIKRVASEEVRIEGCLSKGLRVAIVKEAREGKQFTLKATMADYILISSCLQRSGHRTSIRRKKDGNFVHLFFNTPK